MPVVRVSSLDDPRLADYRNVPDRELLVRRGVFIAEGRSVVARLLAGGRFRLRSILVTEAALASLCAAIDPDADGRPIYLASRALVSAVVGFNVHRGCLAVGERPAPMALADLLAPPARAPLLLLEAIGNPDNIGGLFRNAAAFGARGVVLDARCGDPLYRKAIRVSMGGAFDVPFVRIDRWAAALEAIAHAGWRTVALTPDAAVPPLAEILEARPQAPPAFLLGHEGSGLSPAARAGVEAEARVPMAPAVDSLNVSVAAAVALYAAQERSRQDEARERLDRHA